MLHKLPTPKTTRRQPAVGRGYGRRGGHTAGRGTKGQKSRSGYSRPRPGFEGGQNPLSRRLPKLPGFSRGFRTANVLKHELQLSEVAAAVKGDVVNVESLSEAGMLRGVSKKVQVKILFDREIDRPLTVEGIPVSKSAAAAIAKAGGSVV